MSTQPETPAAASSEEDALSIDQQGIPTLFDVVLTGDQMRQTSISLLAEPSGRAGPVRRVRQDPDLDLDERIRAAVNAALPKVTERTATALRDALLQEVQDTLQEPRP